jgi:hypothetical protein
MCVPVTTKPYLNSFIFSILQQGVPAFFFINQRETPSTICFLQKQESWAYHLALCGIIPNPDISGLDNSASQFKFATLLKLESHYD